MARSPRWSQGRWCVDRTAEYHRGLASPHGLAIGWFVATPLATEELAAPALRRPAGLRTGGPFFCTVSASGPEGTRRRVATVT